MVKRVQANWLKPRKVSKNDSNIKIECSLDKNGKIENIQIIQSSGSKDMDSSAITAIYKSAPFPEFILFQQHHNHTKSSVIFNFQPWM